MDQRLTNEIEHGMFLVNHDPGEIWNWESPAGKVRWKRRVGMLTSSIMPGMAVLELGCGTGYFTKEILSTGAIITAIDISPDLLDIARKNISASNLTFYLENAYSMSFHDMSFDFVIGSSVLHHLDIRKALGEIYRVLKPGGMAYFTEPNMMNPQIAIQKNIPFIKRKLGDSPDETAFFRFSLKRWMKKAGFQSVQITPFDFLHPAIPEKGVSFVDETGKKLEKIPLLKEIAGSLYIKAGK
ncbi:MAG: class I SAM-dependent methyltransferase [Bacteroidetes bacterium]|nr:class I SAM-dependent methyltransferase [Bacteroidota bacterium]